MQISFTFAAEKRLPDILSRLRAVYGEEQRGNSDPLSQLVFTLIGEKTPGAVALASFHLLRREFPRWADIRDATSAALTPSLRGVADFARKAETLPQLMKAIELRHGLLELDFLESWSTEAARNWLEALPGVSPTASAATLNFSTLRRTILSVDHESARVVRRLNLVPSGAAFSSLDRHIMERIPANWGARELRNLHDGLGRLARKLCHQGKPECKHCPLADLCPTAARGSASILTFPPVQKLDA